MSSQFTIYIAVYYSGLEASVKRSPEDTPHLEKNALEIPSEFRIIVESYLDIHFHSCLNNTAIVCPDVLIKRLIRVYKSYKFSILYLIF